MITTELAMKLRDAGLKWEPQVGDQYTFEPLIVQPLVKRPNQPPFLTITADCYSLNNPCAVRRYRTPPPHSVWLPRQEQLLAEISRRSVEAVCEPAGTEQQGEFRCTISTTGQPPRSFWGATPEEATGQALLWIISSQKSD